MNVTYLVVKDHFYMQHGNQVNPKVIMCTTELGQAIAEANTSDYRIEKWVDGKCVNSHYYDGYTKVLREGN